MQMRRGGGGRDTVRRARRTSLFPRPRRRNEIFRYQVPLCLPRTYTVAAPRSNFATYRKRWTEICETGIETRELRRAYFAVFTDTFQRRYEKSGSEDDENKRNETLRVRIIIFSLRRGLAERNKSLIKIPLFVLEYKIRLLLLKRIY